MRRRRQLRRWILGGTGALAAALAGTAHAQSSDKLLDLLVQKGVITGKEASDLKAEASQTNAVPVSKWKLSNAIKDIGLYGDVRFRYEYRGADTVGSRTGYKERFRYAFRAGLRGDILDDFYYGVRLETSQNSRSTWVTFGDESGSFPGPSSKSSDSIYLGQIYLGWKPTDWLDLTVGRMPNPLYKTSLIWDGDINPEGAAERFKHSFGDVDVFGTFGQFLYQSVNPAQPVTPFFGTVPGNQSDVFLLAWQVGANVRLNRQMSFKVAPTLYNYTGHGQNAGFNGVFIGEGFGNGANTTYPNSPSAPDPYGAGYFYNQTGINNLLVVEVPGELNFKLGPYPARIFGDFAMNLDGSQRAQRAFAAATQYGLHLPHAYPNDNKAYQIGFGIGNLGLASGTTSKKHTWEASAYWQHTEQYAVDVNLNDSDFFEGRGNLEGVYSAFAYSFTDSIIGTVRYGYAHKINPNLGTGGSNQDIPNINPINYYNLLQFDLTWRF